MEDLKKILVLGSEGDFVSKLRSMSFVVTLVHEVEQGLAVLRGVDNFICVFGGSEDLEGGFKFREDMSASHKQELPYLLVVKDVTKDIAMRAVEAHVSAYVDPCGNEEALQTTIKRAVKKRVLQLEEKSFLSGVFLEEAVELMLKVEPLLLSLSECKDKDDQVNSIFRCIHTIKGGSGVLGLPYVTDYLHAYEDILSQLRKGHVRFEERTVTVLLKGLDTLRDIVTSVQEKGSPPEHISATLALFKDLLRSALEAPDSAGEETKETVTNEVSKKSGHAVSDIVHVPGEYLHCLLEKSGELTVIRSMLNKAVEPILEQCGRTAPVTHLLELVEEMHKTQSVMQNTIFDMRKVSLHNTLQSITRAVRDTANSTNKKVKLNLIGEELRVDTEIGRVLSESLIHLVRNAVDHGIETPDVRLENGKEAEGLLEISFIDQNEVILVEIRDNGGGIPRDRIEKRVIAQNLMTAEDVKSLSDRAVIQKIFEPGFSTAEAVTDISGRGVGMDAVKNSVEGIGGQLIVESEVGKGSVFRLTLPVPQSVTITQALMIMVADQHFAIPQASVKRVVHIHDSEKDQKILRCDSSLILDDNGELIPILSLCDFLSVSSEEVEKDFVDIVILEENNMKSAIIVDDIQESEDIVVKKMADYLNHTGAYLGSTFLGDGDIALVLNPEPLCEQGALIKGSKSIDEEIAEGSCYDDLMSVLIIKSDHNRIAIEMSYVFRIEKIEDINMEDQMSSSVVYRGESLKVYSVFDLLFHGQNKKCECQHVLILDFGKTKLGLIVDDIIGVSEVKREFDLTKTHSFSKGLFFDGGKVHSLLDLESVFTYIQSLYRVCA